MNEQYSIFRTFSNAGLAGELIAMLNDNNIETIFDDNLPPVDVTFSGSEHNKKYEVRIKQSDFPKAEQLLEERAEKMMDNIPTDYYLLEFTDEELYDILLKSDEWNKFDYTLAQKLLEQRGKPIDENLLASLKKQRLEDLAKPDEGQKPWILAGYFLALLGGFIGIIIGYFLWTGKKTLPNGEKVYSYNPNDRRHGKYIFYIGIIILPTAILIRIVNSY